MLTKVIACLLVFWAVALVGVIGGYLAVRHERQELWR